MLFSCPPEPLSLNTGGGNSAAEPVTRDHELSADCVRECVREVGPGEGSGPKTSLAGDAKLIERGAKRA